MRTRACFAAAAAAVCLTAPGAALAFTPKTGMYTSGGEGGAFAKFTGKKIAKDAAMPSSFKCNKFNAVIPSAMAVNDGAFSYKGKLKGQPGTIAVKGHWKTATTIAVTATITKGSCTSKVKAKLTRLEPPAVG